MEKEPEKRPRFWKSLPKEDKKGVVRSLLEAGYTRAAVGKALGTTKDAVVGYQHRYLPELTGKSEGTLETVPDDVLQELVGQEWPIERNSTQQNESATVVELPEVRTCKWPLASGGSLKEPKLCGKPALPGEDVCEEHRKRLDELLGKR
jgi:hypothetical protein